MDFLIKHHGCFCLIEVELQIFRRYSYQVAPQQDPSWKGGEPFPANCRHLAVEFYWGWHSQHSTTNMRDQLTFEMRNVEILLQVYCLDISQLSYQTHRFTRDNQDNNRMQRWRCQTQDLSTGYWAPNELYTMGVEQTKQQSVQSQAMMQFHLDKTVFSAAYDQNVGRMNTPAVSFVPKVNRKFASLSYPDKRKFLVEMEWTQKYYTSEDTGDTTQKGNIVNRIIVHERFGVVSLFSLDNFPFKLRLLRRRCQLASSVSRITSGPQPSIFMYIFTWITTPRFHRFLC